MNLSGARKGKGPFPNEKLPATGTGGCHANVNIHAYAVQNGITKRHNNNKIRVCVCVAKIKWLHHAVNLSYKHQSTSLYANKS